MSEEYEIVRYTSSGVEILETRGGILPKEGELIQVFVDGQDVEWYVVGIETVNKRDGRVRRVTVNSGSSSSRILGY